MILRATATVLCLPLMAAAQDAPDLAPDPALMIELNSAQSVDGACRLTFLVRNALGGDLQQLAVETVILTGDGIVERLTLFDFLDLPAHRPRVRQFDLAGIDCARIGAVLINGVSTCTGHDLDPAACVAGLSVSSRVDGVEVIG